MVTTCQSSRAVFEVLDGEDPAVQVIQASTTADITTLSSLLAQPSWNKTVMQESVCIYAESRRSADESDVRYVSAKPMSHLERAVINGAKAGNAPAVSILLKFATRHGVDLDLYNPIKFAVEQGDVALIEAIATGHPNVIYHDLGPGNKRPLDYAVKRRQVEVVRFLLQAGAAATSPAPNYPTAEAYQGELLGQAARVNNTNMTELLLQHKFPITGSAALQAAASQGSLGNMRLLIRHGADVDERSHIVTSRWKIDELRASWTPMHWAASRSRLDAVELLVSEGANSTILDKNGKTAWQVLEEMK